MSKFAVGYVVAFIATAFLLLPGCTPPESASISTENQAAQGDAPGKADAILRRMAEYLCGLPAYSCRIQITFHVQSKDVNEHNESIIAARVQRPNRLAVLVEEDKNGVSVLSDGKQLVLFLSGSNRYVVRDAPADIDDFPAAVKGLGISLMGNLLPTNAEEFYGAITKGVTRSEYLGTEKIGDVPCDRCRFFRDNSHWDIWIASGDEPVVHQVVPDMSQEVKNDPSLKGSKLDFKVAFSDWNVAPQFTDSDFAFTPPADSEQVDSLFRKRQAPHELLGKAAPTFQTVDPDGKTIDLSTHLGKNVIMLDFWATWCGPCIMAMPQLEAVGKKFADQGLVFYSVDLGEDTETVKQFLATNELHLSVAMDPDGKIGAAYNVEGIPQTVLIGKDGTVQVVHVGFNDALGEVVTTQIEALLAGKNLAAAAAANDGSETGE